MTPPWKLSTVTRAQTIRYIVLLISCCRHRQFKLLILMGFSFLLILEKSKLQQHLLCLERHCQANTLCVNTETNYCFNNNVLYTHVFLDFSIYILPPPYFVLLIQFGGVRQLERNPALIR